MFKKVNNLGKGNHKVGYINIEYIAGDDTMSGKQGLKVRQDRNKVQERYNSDGNSGKQNSAIILAFVDKEKL